MVKTIRGGGGVSPNYYKDSKNENLDSIKLVNLDSAKDKKDISLRLDITDNLDSIESKTQNKETLSHLSKTQNLDSKRNKKITESKIINTKNKHGIVFYNEGRQYFDVFHPIIECFEALNYPYTYYTSASNDPLLKRKNTRNIIEFIGDSNKAYLKLNALNADIVMMSTPQLDVLQIKRSKGVAHYCHIIHSLPHVDNYEVFALDYFDSVFTNSPIHTDFIRMVEKKRNLKHKKIKITGCTYLDALSKKLENIESNKETKDSNKETQNNQQFIYNKTFKDSNKKVVLISPSWGREALLSKYGFSIIKPLLESNFNIIIRPHPQSLITETHMLDSIKKQTQGYSNIAWDTHTHNIYAMKVSDIMLGDFSGILFDYLCLFQKPIAVMRFDFNITGYDLEDIYDTPWVKGALAKISKSINKNDLGNIANILESMINNNELSNNILEMRELLWKHRGKSAEITTLELLKIHKEILESKLQDKYEIYHNLSKIDDILELNLAESNFQDSKGNRNV